ncbi:hypothetical protein KKH36_02270 [Patescibacteria group bacterium]|nr:hypothetical protein [Patescibacteria group bacterium]
MGEFKKGDLVEDLILLALAGVEEIVHIGNLIERVENSPFKNHGLTLTRGEIKEEIFDLILSGCISLDNKRTKENFAENFFKISKEGIALLRKNKLFKEIAENFPVKKEEEKKK